MSAGHHHRGGHRGRRARGRRRTEAGEWTVEAPIARFVEPAALLVLRAGPRHGYDLAEGIGEITGLDKVDYGNLYRLLRRLESEGIVASEWSDDGTDSRSRRVYELLPAGVELLDAWITALESTQDRITAFLETYHGGST